MIVAAWNPNLHAAVLILGMMIGLFVPDLLQYLRRRRFFSPERKRLRDVSRWWQERAR